MPWETYVQSFVGGTMIGLAAALLLIVNGRVAGVSGIVGGLLARINGATLERGAFLVGLLIAPLVFLAVFGAWPAITITHSLVVLGVGGLLVGFGTRMSGGCTSGHGVCGLGRLSRRSIVAVATFFAVAMVTVLLMNHGFAS